MKTFYDAINLGTSVFRFSKTSSVLSFSFPEREESHSRFQSHRAVIQLLQTPFPLFVGYKMVVRLSFFEIFTAISPASLSFFTILETVDFSSRRSETSCFCVILGWDTIACKRTNCCWLTPYTSVIRFPALNKKAPRCRRFFMIRSSPLIHLTIAKLVDNGTLFAIGFRVN